MLLLLYKGVIMMDCSNCIFHCKNMLGIDFCDVSDSYIEDTKEWAEKCPFYHDDSKE